MTARAGMSFALRQAENGFFYIYWSDGRRSVRQSTRVQELAPAKAFLAAWLITGDGDKKIAIGPTCAELWELYWRDHVHPKCANTDTHKYAWQALKARFGKMRPAEVTRETIKEHLASRRPARPSSLFVELRLLTASWNYAIKRRVILPTDVPALDDLDIPAAPPPRTRWLRQKEVEALFAAAVAIRRRREETRLLRVERFMWLALETAARRNAILELKWNQVDFETQVIQLNPDGRVQTSKRRASVPISDALLAVLQRAYKERISDFVLDHDSRLHDALNAVAEAAGVQGVTAHVFRHTAATWMARKGIPLFQIAKYLGNTVEEVERTYAKHNVDDLRDAANLLGGSVAISLGLET